MLDIYRFVTLLKIHTPGIVRNVIKDIFGAVINVAELMLLKHWHYSTLLKCYSTCNVMPISCKFDAFNNLNCIFSTRGIWLR